LRFIRGPPQGQITRKSHIAHGSEYGGTVKITGLYKDIETNSELIKSFLVTEGIDEGEISFAIPVITDKSAQSFGNNLPPEFRYSASVRAVTLRQGL